MNDTDTVTITSWWTKRGCIRRILRGADLKFTEDRNLFRAEFEVEVTPEQHGYLLGYWDHTDAVQISESVVQ